ncbi:uncharacterized / related to thiamin pyrophosphokinase [Sporisorium reilianum f. sp. reilianum]|uniref:Uncharacterized / related to thiamin pyrophosphokinase n=1 Tax=Sporisorium reilianum f. sp. reilianum TaxID=72559 RepID=A0A2N8UDL9_9BASI|nr:uncharacterized / related to thiamin pyrophosphokinase [Sporisorium reilianum f. sp. reilianum]
MSRSGESFTLLESGTSRIHFKLAKELEEASSPLQQDIIIMDTVAHLRKQLSSRSFSADVSKLTSALVTLLHCLQHYPTSTSALADRPSSIDASFALLPTLQLLSLATSWKDLLIAYQLLPFLLPQSDGPARRTKGEAAPTSAASSTVAPHPAADDSSSLLLLNTFRANLSAATEDARQQVSRRDTDKRSRSPSRSRSSSRPAPQAKDALLQTSFRALASLKSLVTGTPRGPAVLPSLASTLVELTRHSDSSIRSMTLNAMLSCASIASKDSSDSDGQAEMLDAAITIVRLTLASTYAFSPGSNLDENHGMILAEMERRVDSSPNVLRACIRIVDHARAVGLITSQEAACHTIEVLQATRWAPMHLEVLALQQQRLASAVVGRTEGLRARTAARQRPSLQAEHDYHGTYAPWLVDACLSSLTISFASMLEPSSPLDDTTRKEMLKAVLRIYHVASQGKAAALVLCVSAARCIGALHLVPPSTAATSEPAGDRDGELAALWATLSTHVKAQLHSTNPNRKTAGIVLLDALLPLGWAQAKSEGDATMSSPDERPSPLGITEAEMGQLMALLADPDASIRKRALALLHRVDPGLTALLRSQLQSAVDEMVSARATNDASRASIQPDDASISLAKRLVEVALFAVSTDAAPASVEAMAALEGSLTSALALDLFGSFARSSSASRDAWSAQTLISISSLPIARRIQLLQRLMTRVTDLKHPSELQSGLHLCCCLLVDLGVGDLQGSAATTEAFVKWIDTDLLGSRGLSSVLWTSSGIQSSAVAAREVVLGIIARTISLVVSLSGSEQASRQLASGLGGLQSTLSKLVEVEEVAAVRLEAGNLQLICRTLLEPTSAQNEHVMDRLKALAVSSHTLQEATSALLELDSERVPSSRTEEEDSRSNSSTISSTSLLATASQLFAPNLRLNTRTSDHFAAARPSPRLPNSVLQSSRLLSPRDSTATLRSSRSDSRSKHSKAEASGLASTQDLHVSAIPSESKRLRDRSIAQAMSESIANLVLGSDAKSPPTDTQVIFSATSSGVLEEELELIDEVADPERRLDSAAKEGHEPSLLDLVHQCHNHEPWLDTTLTPFVLDGVQIGFLPARVVKACLDDSAEQLRAGSPPVLRKIRFAMKHREIVPPTASSRVCEAITFTSHYTTPEARTTGLNAVAQRWRQARIFPDPLDGWRDELYAIYGLNPQPGSRNPIAFKLERAACALFGFATFGVHLTAYTVEPTTGELKVWVPQRSSTKSTWPGYLDNSVAGGIVAGDLPMESMVRECEEEANLEQALVERHIKQTGVLSYCYRTQRGWIQPEVEYVYDLPLPADVELQPKDGEVDHFELMTLEQVYGKMREGKFKANCVLVLLDFLIRHGHITADGEAGYRQIVAQLHVDLRLPGP